MKKTHLAVGLAVMLSANAAQAALYDFEDMIDDWPVLGFEVGAAPIYEGHPLTYTHDIRDDVNFGAGDTVVQAYLELDFTNDWLDKVIFGYDNREFVRVGYDGAGWTELGEVDAGQYEVVLDIDWLNDDGLLDVTINVDNEGWNWASAYLDHSRLYGTAQTVNGPAPVPEPAAVALLGLGLLGLGAAHRRGKRN